MQKLKLAGTALCLIFITSACAAQESSTDIASGEDQLAAPPAPQQACQDAEYRQLDFWVGEWDLSWTQADGSEGSGTNNITRSPFGDCVITENFDGNPTLQFKGMSVSTYFKPAGLWRQAWVDDQGGFFSLHGGPQEDGRFILDLDRVNDEAPYLRMVWEEITDDSLIWRWQGKASVDAEWADRWVINYKRKGT